MTFSFLPPPRVACASLECIDLPVWAAPLPTGDCGPNLEYDNSYLEVFQAAQGRPETQFDAGTPPDWSAVETGASTLLERSRDLRLVVLWTQARLNLHGFSALASGFAALAALLRSAWPSVNPPLDDGDPYARLNVIESLGQGGTFFLSLRQCVVLRNPRLGELRLKDFEALAGHGDASALPVAREQLEQFFIAEQASADTLRNALNHARLALNELFDVLKQRVEAADLPELSEVKALLAHVHACLPVKTDMTSMEQTPADLPLNNLSGVEAIRSNQPVGVQSSFAPGLAIASRAQAVAAIEAVCVYLSHAEPSNPAQLLLKRAKGLLDKNFLQLVKELAPEALAEVSKIMGVNPDFIEQDEA